MLTIDRDRSALLVVDFQSRLMPAIEGGSAAVDNARRLVAAADLFGVPVLFTEQNPRGLGPTVPELAPSGNGRVATKMTFDACRTPGFLDRLCGRTEIVVAGCETHVCVMQTVLGLIDSGRRVHLVRDAVGSRRAESKETAIARMARHGAEIVTTEMVVFEWLGSAEDPRLRAALDLVR
jgi:nicotinamidase-related amidase